MRFGFRIFTFILILTLILICGCSSQNRALSSLSRPEKPVERELQENLEFSAVLSREGTVELTWDLKSVDSAGFERITIFRSVEDLETTQLNLTLFSITPIIVEFPAVKSTLEDKKIGDGVTYHYMMEVLMKEGNPRYSKVISVKTPSKSLSALHNPWIHIDKINYLLEVIEGKKVRKRYPISLGKDPFRRKLHQDNATTPEGIYHIINLQPRATYYKAYDLNYPNKTDETRYKLSIMENLITKNNGVIPGIGGEIQIHGGYDEVGQNWTAGCITLRNADMDELFSNKEIAVDTRVVITGRELTFKDLEEMGKERSADEMKAIQLKLKKEGFNPMGIDGKMGDNTRRALSRLQVKYDLPVTMDLDERTVKVLEDIKEDKR